MFQQVAHIVKSKRSRRSIVRQQNTNPLRSDCPSAPSGFIFGGLQGSPVNYFHNILIPTSYTISRNQVKKGSIYLAILFHERFLLVFESLFTR